MVVVVVAVVVVVIVVVVVVVVVTGWSVLNINETCVLGPYHQDATI